MTAFYELNIEQGATFVVPIKIVKNNGALFNFLPRTVGENNPTTSPNYWWKNLLDDNLDSSPSALNFDVPEELLLYNLNSFDWLKNPNLYNDKTVIVIKAQIKDKRGIIISGGEKYRGKTTYKAFEASGTNIWSYSEEQDTDGVLKMKLFPATSTVDREWNLLITIDSDQTGIDPPLKGKYIYDIEIDYYPNNNSTGSTPIPPCVGSTKPVLLPNGTASCRPSCCDTGPLAIPSLDCCGETLPPGVSGYLWCCNQTSGDANTTQKYTIRILQGIINVNPNITG